MKNDKIRIKKNYFSWILTTIFVFLLLSSGLAQIGIKAGIGASDIGFKKWGQTPYLSYEVDYLEHEKPLFTYQFGAFATFNLGERWEFQPELLFITKGINYNKKFLYDDITYKMNISYLELPILVKYKITKGKKVETALFVAPYIAQKLSAMKTTKYEGVREQLKVTNVESLDYGGMIGCSFDFGKIYNIDFRVSYSLVNMMEPLPGHLPVYGKNNEEYVRNINISLSVGYRLNNLINKKQE